MEPTNGNRPCNRPDLTHRDRKGTGLLLDVSIPTDRNVVNESLLIEIQHMRKVKAKVKPTMELEAYHNHFESISMTSLHTIQNRTKKRRSF
jgi:hypothetical protein